MVLTLLLFLAILKDASFQGFHTLSCYVFNGFPPSGSTSVQWSPIAFLLQGAFLVAAVSSRPATKLHGEITSPNYPKTYPNNNISTWDISVPKGYRVKLSFRLFDLEPSETCQYDFVKITANKKDLGRLCGQVDSATGNHPKDKEFLSANNHMRLLFQSDFSNEENGIVVSYKGFLAYYEAVDLDECAPRNDIEDGPQCQHFCHNYIGGYFCSCQPGYQLQSDGYSCKVDCSNELFTETFGYLSSPGYPEPYPPNLQCNYSIRVEKGMTIILKFLQPFEIDDHQQVRCPYDQLKIHAGMKQIGEFCGRTPPGVIETNSSSVDVVFLTDESGYSRGWKISYSIERIRCPQPVVNDVFTIIKDPQPLYQYQDYFIVSCKTGYNLMEFEDVWTSTPRIPQPATLAGEFWELKFTHLQTAKGKEHLTAFTSVCQHDGTWHRPMPRCEIVNCGEPKFLKNGEFNFISATKNNNYESVIKYRCNEPYYRLLNTPGKGIYTCSAGGSWKDQVNHDDIPMCLPVCGKPDNPVVEVQRIIGGKDAPRGSFPWQAMTVIAGRAGGALLGDRWILTAAHVVYPKGKGNDTEMLTPVQVAEKAEIFLGHTDVTELYKVGNKPILRLFVHPDYNPEDEHNFDGDIALIELRDPVTLGRDMLPICLPESGNTTYYHTGWMGYASGFGVEKNILASRLKYAPIPVGDQDLCRKWLKGKKISDKDPVFSDNMFCAGTPYGGKDTCQGDSGGALAVRDPETQRWVATGIVSWGLECGKGYGFYTKIMNYLDWIKGIVGKDWVTMQVSH